MGENMNLDLKSQIKALKKARDLINKGWIKNQYAADKRGYGVDPRRKDAVKFCVFGAVERATNSKAERDQLIEVLNGKLNAAHYECNSLFAITDFNDAPSTRKPRVVALFNRAIKSLEQQTQ
jgi:hypothetical protein